VSLVLDWGNGTFSDPVDGVGKVGDIEDLNSLLWDWLGHLESKNSLSLFLSPGGECVDTDGMGLSWIVVDGIDLQKVLLEKGESELVLFSSSIRLAKFGEMCHELVLFSGHKFVLLSEELSEEASVG